jgi:hypothetical protein
MAFMSSNSRFRLSHLLKKGYALAIEVIQGPDTQGCRCGTGAPWVAADEL